MPERYELGPHRSQGLVDILDRILDKGLVIAGDINPAEARKKVRAAPEKTARGRETTGGTQLTHARRTWLNGFRIHHRPPAVSR